MNKSSDIIEEIKNSFRELKYDLVTQDGVPVELRGIYDKTPIFTLYFSNYCMNFENLYNNKAYHSMIRNNLNEGEKFLIESIGVSFEYFLHKKMIQKMIPKIIISLKNFYIMSRKECLENDFRCRR